MHLVSRLGRSLAFSLVAAAVLAGCTSGPRRPAPVEDKGSMAQQRGQSPSATPSQPAGDAAARVLPGAENAGKPGYYTVRPGDTLIRISLDSGQNWRDIARWNGVTNPNVIEVGQVLRIIPPAGEAVARPVAPAQVTAQPVVPSGGAVGQPLPPASQARAAEPAASQAQPAQAAQPAQPAQQANSQTPVGPDDDIAWSWPTPGNTSVIAGFDEARNKGLDIGGKAGDPVFAAADGGVAYAGAGLRGYGNLVILKHNNTYLTAYAHNQTLLVKEDQTVRKGQKIAEMGSTDADRVKLHFEIRRQGKPVDPARFLPAR